MDYKTVALATILLNSISSAGIASEQNLKVDSSAESKAAQIAKDCDVKLDKSSTPTKTEINNGDGRGDT